MNNNQAMISAVMLESIWASRKQDMVDLVAPFIMYATATLTSPGKQINTKQVLLYVQKHFAYPDMPEEIVRRVLARSIKVTKVKSKYILTENIDTEVEKMNIRRKKCEDSIEDLGIILSEYLNKHCKVRKNRLTANDAVNNLHQFFSRYGLQVGTDNLASVHISPKEYEIDYYIAQFIFENKDRNNEIYQKIIDLVKGYFLRLAIYIQPTDGDILSATYKDTVFIYDTPILLDILGYSGKEREDSAIALHKAIERQHGKICYFPHIKDEIISILTAYKHSLDGSKKSIKSRTLEGLDDKNYRSEDVEREISLLSTRLENKFKITEYAVPLYEQKADETVDESKILGEEEIKKYIKENTKHYLDDNLENDVNSALAVHRLRAGITCDTIESSKFLFVTNNADFLYAFNAYYKENVDKKTFPIVISDSNLSAITWVKSGKIDNISETQLIKNAYIAMQPIPEIMSKVEDIFEKMKEQGDITTEQVVVLRASRCFKNEIWQKSFGEVDIISELTVQEAQKKYEEQLIEEEKNKHKKELEEKDFAYSEQLGELNQKLTAQDIKYAHERKLLEQDLTDSHKNVDRLQKEFSEYKDENKRNEKEREEKIRKKSDEEAKKEGDKYLKLSKKILNIVLGCFIISFAVATIITTVYEGPIWLIVSELILTFVAVYSLYDLLKSKRAFIVNILERKANQRETKVREEKYREYRDFL